MSIEHLRARLEDDDRPGPAPTPRYGVPTAPGRRAAPAPAPDDTAQLFLPDRPMTLEADTVGITTGITPGTTVGATAPIPPAPAPLRPRSHRAEGVHRPAAAAPSAPVGHSAVSPPPPSAHTPEPEQATRVPRLPDGTRLIVLIAASTGLSGWLAGAAAQSVSGNKNAPWILGRASGICTYLLMVALVAMGLVLSHPWRARWRRPSAVLRIRAHVSLAAFTLAFLVLHIVVLATDKYAKVGWWGALLPMASDYRPLPVTLGVIATYGGIAAGVTAAAAGRWAGRVWWPVHKVAGISLVLAWLHGVFTGIDTRAIAWLYAVTAIGLVALAASRYMVRTPNDIAAEFSEDGR